jgi:hypothetical protein
MKGSSSPRPRAWHSRCRPRTHSRKSASISRMLFPNSLTLIGEAPGKLAKKLERLSDINRTKWDSLSDQHKAAIESACGDLTRDVIAEGEATQWRAMTEMRDKHGVRIKKWSPEIMGAIEKAWHDVVAEESAANPNCKRVYASYRLLGISKALERALYIISMTAGWLFVVCTVVIVFDVITPACCALLLLAGHRVRQERARALALWLPRKVGFLSY